VDAARALADLVEISPQIEAALVVAGGGDTMGSFGVPEARASILARVARELLDGAAAFRTDGRLTQLHASLAGGDVFAVNDAGGRTIVAVASGQGAPGLVFYDLKRCLAGLDGEGGAEA